MEGKKRYHTNSNSKIMAILIKVLPSPQNILKNERLMYKTQLHFYAVSNEYEETDNSKNEIKIFSFIIVLERTQYS